MAALSAKDPLRVECADVTACSISHWYPLNKKATFATRVVPLSEAFVAFLGSDGPMVLPETSKGARVGSRGATAVDDDCELSDDDGDDDDDERGALRFPEVEAAAEAAIAELGGVAFCKLNWSAPRDAAWLTGGSLRCECAGDAFALLAASEFAKHDACRAYARCVDAAEPDAVRCDLVLAFRAWQDLDPAREFRCFVLDGRLVAACQRKIDAAFDDLAAAAADELGEDDDGDRVLDGVRRKIAALLDSGLDLPRHCVVDVAVQGARATLVDVNVASEDTDPLLFTWPELLDLRATTVAAPRPSSSAFELRVVDADSPAVQPSELSSFRAPLDVAAIAEAGGLDELLAAMQQQQRLDGDSSSEDDDEQASNH